MIELGPAVIIFLEKNWAVGFVSDMVASTGAVAEGLGKVSLAKAAAAVVVVEPGMDSKVMVQVQVF